MEIHVGDFVHRYRWRHAVPEHALIQSLAAGIDHSVEEDDVAEFKLAQRRVVDRDLEALAPQPAARLFSAVVHSTLSRLR